MSKGLIRVGLPIPGNTEFRVISLADPYNCSASAATGLTSPTTGIVSVEPILRGLAARAPYFHNGSAATLLDVVNFYDVRFGLALSEQDKRDLAALLQTL